MQLEESPEPRPRRRYLPRGRYYLAHVPIKLHRNPRGLDPPAGVCTINGQTVVVEDVGELLRTGWATIASLAAVVPRHLSLPELNLLATWIGLGRPPVPFMLKVGGKRRLYEVDLIEFFGGKSAAPLTWVSRALVAEWVRKDVQRQGRHAGRRGRDAPRQSGESVQPQLWGDEPAPDPSGSPDD